MARFIAIDWDQNQLHAVAANIAGGKVIVQQAAVWHEERTPNPGDAEALGKLLKERLKEAGIAPAPLLACIGRDRLQVKDLRYPAVPAPEEPAVVRFQAFKELTEAADEVVLDYAPGQASINTAEKRSLVMIARRLLVKAYQDLAKSAGLKLVALSPRPYGIAAVSRSHPGAIPPELEAAAIAVVVVADHWAEFCVYRGPQLLLARSLAVGPNLAADIRRSLTVHGGQFPQSPAGNLYLAGASAELRETLTDMLPDLPIAVLDPFARQDAIELPPALRGSFAGAVGLLYARAESQGLPINFIHPRQPKAPGKINYRILIPSVVAAAVVVIALLMITRSVVADRKRDADELRSQTLLIKNQLARLIPEGKRIKALDDVQSVVWADEIEALATRLDSAALRVDSLKGEPLNHKEGDPYVARLVITGTIQRGYNRTAVDKLVDAFRQDVKDKADPKHTNFYSPDPPKIENDSKFTVTVRIKRRAPVDFRTNAKGL